jgi:prephenate dehydrogenase
MNKEESTDKRPFSAITIVGLGLIGGSLALALRRSGFNGKIIGVSRQSSLREAKRLNAIDEGFSYEELPSAVRTSDLIVLTSPISTIVEHLKVLGAAEDCLKKGAIITDVGSTKRSILQAGRESLPKHTFFIGGHPLSGSERRGMAAADPFLFQNAYYVLTPDPKIPQVEVERLGTFLESTGTRVVVLSAEDHDRIAATISHLPQLLAVSLVRFLDNLGKNREHGIRLAAGGFRDMTRIASSPYSVWRDIISTNGDVIAEIMDDFLESARQAHTGLEDEKLSHNFSQAAQTRAEIPRDSKGFLHQLWDVLVVVEDRPGMIAGIANPLAEKGINIKDIEVLKVREGEAGTIRLAFESQEQANKAVNQLSDRGYTARLRE